MADTHAFVIGGGLATRSAAALRLADSGGNVVRIMEQKRLTIGEALLRSRSSGRVCRWTTASTSSCGAARPISGFSRVVAGGRQQVMLQPHLDIPRSSP